MNESQFWQKLKPQLNANGFAFRLENSAAVSVPDVAFLNNNLTIWIELKIIKSNKFVMVPFQYAFGVKLARALDKDLFWIFADYKGKLLGIQYKDIIGHGVSNKKIVEFNIHNIGYMEIPNVSAWITKLINGDYND